MLGRDGKTLWGWLPLTLALSVMPTSPALAALSAENYGTLHKDIFGQYSSFVRPVTDNRRATTVDVTVHLLSVMEVKEREQSFINNLMLEMAWTDEQLVWNTTQHFEIPSILVPQTKVWRPDIVLANPVSSSVSLGHSDQLVRVEKTGRVTWKPSGVFETGCRIDVTYYPLDTQKCTVIFKTEMSLSSEISLRVKDICLRRFSPNGQWKLLDQTAQVEDDPLDPQSKPLVIRFELKRRRFFFYLNVIFPVVLMSLTSSLVFALPADSGEKMGLSITVLLTYAVYLTLVNDAMPRTSMEVSLMGVYLMLLLIVCTLNVVLTACILRLHHRPDSHPVPHWLHYTALVLGRILRYTDHKDAPRHVNSEPQYLSPPVPPYSASPVSPSAPRCDVVSVKEAAVDMGDEAEVSDYRITPRLPSPRSGLPRSGKARRALQTGSGARQHKTRVNFSDRERKGRAKSAFKTRSWKTGPGYSSSEESGSTERRRPGFANQYHRAVEDSGSPPQSFAKEKLSPSGRVAGPLSASLAVSKRSKEKQLLTGKMVARTLDYFLFWACTIVCLGTTVLCVLSLTVGAATKAIDTSLL